MNNIQNTTNQDNSLYQKKDLTPVQRFFVLVYMFLHIPILMIAWSMYDQFNYKDHIGVNTYKATCTENKRDVVLQGETDGSPYTFDDVYFRTNKSEIETRMSFYCEYYDELQKHIQAYMQADTNLKETLANRAFWQFEESKPKITKDNFTLEIVDTKNDYGQIFWLAAAILVFVTGYYIGLQTIRISYVYVVFGRLVWHPYKLPV